MYRNKAFIITEEQEMKKLKFKIIDEQKEGNIENQKGDYLDDGKAWVESSLCIDDWEISVELPIRESHEHRYFLVTDSENEYTMFRVKKRDK